MRAMAAASAGLARRVVMGMLWASEAPRSVARNPSMRPRISSRILRNTWSRSSSEPEAAEGSSKLQWRRAVRAGKMGQRSFALSHTVMTQSQGWARNRSNVFELCPPRSIPTSPMTRIASGWTRVASVPALAASNRSPPSARRKPSAIWLRAELCVQRKSTRRLVTRCSLRRGGRARGEPAARPVAEGADRQHDRHLDQHAHDRRQRRAGCQAEERDRRRHRQLEEVARADQRAGSRHRVRDLEPAGQAVGQARVEIHLDQERDRDQDYMKEVAEDHVALESEDQHEGREERHDRHRLEVREEDLLE